MIKYISGIITGIAIGAIAVVAAAISLEYDPYDLDC